jgi:hypothetical protein
MGDPLSVIGAPRRGSKKVAQGKAAEAAFLGKNRPPGLSFFLQGSGAPPARQTPEGKKKGDHFGFVTQGGAALALG